MTRLKYRIPIRIRHYWRLLATCAAVVIALAVLFGTVRVAPLVTSASDESGDEVTVDITGTEDLFDATVAHSIKLTFHDADYERLLDSFWKDGEKDFLEADMTVDGTTLPSVGIRLKGNSTLQSITRNGQSRQSRGGFGGGRSALKTEEPETLPWLIRIDEFVEGRRYQGHREIAVRVGGMGGGASVLNEAVTLNVLAAAGEPVQRYAYTSFSVNDRPATARLIVEHPDENFAGTVGGTGVLYKSLASSQFTYQGDDQTDYEDDFKQINLKGSQDLQPVIDLVKWVNESSDAEFDEHLGDHVDVASFARYAATQNLLVNFDDMAGPGRNYYLWYDLSAKKFKVIGWDYNLALSGQATQDPHESTSMGGGGFPGGGGDFRMPEGMEPPANGGGGFRGGGGGMGGGNKLKERFLASAAYKQAYDDAYRELYTKIFAGAQALNTMDAIVKVIDTVAGADQATVGTEAENLRTLIVERTQFLATNEVITRR